MIKNIKLNFKRLSGKDYHVDKIFKDKDYDWPGDWEGRALLAFCCHYEISGKKIPAMDLMIESLKDKTNEKLFFGKLFNADEIDEQQLSGHNWYLRGLIKYYKLFGSEFAKECAKSTMENLYLPLKNKYKDYPILKNRNLGEVAGSISEKINGWKLSSDVGCAFMCMDAVSKYYYEFKDQRVKELYDSQLERFLTIDYLGQNMQTHAFLTATRSLITMYEATNDKLYLDNAIMLYNFYLENGLTLTYENINWFGKPDSWTEPCAVVDSFIIACKLYSITGDAKYRLLMRRIWFNGLQFCQRGNGGVGPNTCVLNEGTFLKVSMYEAFFCCTMRYAEGLLYYHRYQDELLWSYSKIKEEKDEHGRVFVDDKLMVEFNGIRIPIFSLNDMSKPEALSVKVKIIF